MSEEQTKIIDTPLSEMMESKFLEYAEETIVSRALPKIQDGLKPSQRYTLWAMKEMGLTHTAMHRKCAKVVGVVIGTYHPHGFNVNRMESRPERKHSATTSGE